MTKQEDRRKLSESEAAYLSVVYRKVIEVLKTDCNNLGDAAFVLGNLLGTMLTAMHDDKAQFKTFLNELNEDYIKMFDIVKKSQTEFKKEWDEKPATEK